MRVLAWWCAALPLLPLLVGQAIYLRRTTVRLPEAPDCSAGLAGQGAPVLRLLVIGESTAASVGVKSHDEGLAAQCAQAYYALTGQTVAWRTLGENGIRLYEALDRLVPDQLDADVVLFCFGVNDVTKLTSIKAFEASLTSLCEKYHAQKVRLIFSGVPPMQYFTVLPWPLRHLLGWRAALLNRAIAGVAKRFGAGFLPLPIVLVGDDLAEDGYHPSARGYRLWGKHVALDVQDKFTH